MTTTPLQDRINSPRNPVPRQPEWLRRQSEKAQGRRWVAVKEVRPQ